MICFPLYVIFAFSPHLHLTYVIPIVIFFVSDRAITWRRKSINGVDFYLHEPRVFLVANRQDGIGCSSRGRQGSGQGDMCGVVVGGGGWWLPKNKEKLRCSGKGEQRQIAWKARLNVYILFLFGFNTVFRIREKILRIRILLEIILYCFTEVYFQFTNLNNVC